MYGIKEVGMILEQQLRASILIHGHKTEKERREEEKRLGMTRVFWNPKDHTQWHTSSVKATHANPSQIVPPPGDQVFRYMSLWGPSSSKLRVSLPWLVLIYVCSFFIFYIFEASSIEGCTMTEPPLLLSSTKLQAWQASPISGHLELLPVWPRN